MIYLASPYTHSNPITMVNRFWDTRKFVAQMIKQDTLIFSTIVHNHDLAYLYDLPTDQEFWWKYNRAMMNAADEVWVLKLDGWEDSAGVQREIEYAQTKGIPVEYIDND